MDFRKLSGFFLTGKNDATFLKLELFIYCTAAGVYNKMKTLCILYGRHACLICMLSKATLGYQDNADTLNILFYHRPSVMFYLL